MRKVSLFGIATAAIVLATGCGAAGDNGASSSSSSSGGNDSAASDADDDGTASGDAAGSDGSSTGGSVDGGGGDGSASDSGTTSSSGGDTTGSDSTTAPDVDESKGLQSKELLIKILGPSGRDYVQSQGQSMQLSGVLFGIAEKASWSSSNGKSGDIDVQSYWISGIVELAEGDNTITVQAEAGGKVVKDTMHIVYNPFFSFEGPPQVGPDLLFKSETSQVIVHMPLSAAGTVGTTKGPADPATVKLVQVDETGKILKDWGKLYDDGGASHCDDIQKDSIFSACLNVNAAAVGTMLFRVQVDVSFEIGNKTLKYTAKSPVALIDVVERFNKAACDTLVTLQKGVEAAYLTAAATDAKKAQADAIATLKADAAVAEAGPASSGGYGVWIRYKNGVVGALNLAPAGVRGGAGVPSAANAALPTYSVGTRRALSLAPFAAEFEKSGGDEAAVAGKDLAARECPPFAVDQRIGSAALLKEYRAMSQYGIVAISGHGDALFEGMDTAAKETLNWEHHGSQEVIWTGEKVCDNLSSSTAKCAKTGAGCPTGQTCVITSSNGGTCVDHTQGDLVRGRVVLGTLTYGITPSFIGRHSVEPFPGSIVYLGACRSLYNGSLAVQLYGNGAEAVVGYQDYVSSEFAAKQGLEFWKRLGEGSSVNQALQDKQLDPQWGGRMRMLGNPKSNANDSDLINPSWDLGKLTGWKKVGDGRVISRLGVSVPVAGKFMGIVSTGLGFTTQTGSLEQPFCVGPGKSKLCFFWKFYSEEFLEFCASTYQDKFKATLVGKAGQKTITDVWVDALCPYDCGGKSPCQPGDASCKCGQKWETLTPSDVSFDKGGVHMTPWVESCTDIGAFVNKPATLKFFTSDTGDSIYDTAVLIDKVTIE